MIRQNANEPKRKLLETRSFHFTVFLDENVRIVGFDMEDRNATHLLQWRRGRKPRFYGVANVGKGYQNRDEVYENGAFNSTDAVAELKSFGGNIRSEVCDVLLTGISDYH